MLCAKNFVYFRCVVQTNMQKPKIFTSISMIILVKTKINSNLIVHMFAPFNQKFALTNSHITADKFLCHDWSLNNVNFYIKKSTKQRSVTSSLGGFTRKPLTLLATNQITTSWHSVGVLLGVSTSTGSMRSYWNNQVHTPAWRCWDMDLIHKVNLLDFFNS